jgi:hypothetical protein
MLRVLLLCVALLGLTLPASAADINKATNLYVKGSSLLRSKKYSSALRTFRRAYRYLPRVPRFNCHRTQFRNYIANSLENLRRPYAAMREYYSAAYSTRCKNRQYTGYAARRYRSLYGRWMCSLSLKSNPPNARLILLTSKGDKLWGRMKAGKGFKKVMMPGTFRFKIRLYEHRTVYYTIKLKPGMHVKKVFQMQKGNDPINRKENLAVALPPPVSGGGGATNNNIPSLGNPNPTGNTGNKAPAKKKLTLNLQPDNPKGTGGGGIGANPTIDPLGTKRKIIKNSGPPVYRQPWFWATIGAVVVGATVTAILIPKEQKVLLNKGALF